MDISSEELSDVDADVSVYDVSLISRKNHVFTMIDCISHIPVVSIASRIKKTKFFYQIHLVEYLMKRF